MLTNDLILELALARVWLEQLIPVIGKSNFEKAQKSIERFSSKGFPSRNWKKLLLASFSENDTFQVYQRKMKFVNLNDARALIDELVIDDLYGLSALSDVNHVIDAGASCGLFSRLVSKKFPNALIQMIEPDPHNIDILKYNLERELQSENIILHEGALSNVPGYTIIQAPTDMNKWGGLGASGAQRDRLGIRETYDVKSRSIDLASLIDCSVDLLKCDIEGLEFEVLPAVGSSINNCKRLLVEIHSDVSNFTNKYASLVAFLATNNFELTCYEGAKNCAQMFSGKPFPSFMLCAIKKE